MPGEVAAVTLSNPQGPWARAQTQDQLHSWWGPKQAKNGGPLFKND